MKKAVQLMAKGTGIIAGAGTCTCWLLAMLKPLPALPLTGIAFFVALLMMVLAIIAISASIHGHGITLIVLFFASFFPIGLYLIDDPDWIRVIGYLNIGFLIAGLLIWLLQRGERPVGKPDS